MKKCSKCKLDKEDVDFNKYKNGLQNWCRLCCKEYDKINKEKNSKIDKEYYLKNKEKLNARAKLWNLKNKEKTKLYALRGKDKRIEKMKLDPSIAKKYNKTRRNINKRLKKELISYKGDKCSNCGYNKCLEALDFHHLDPKTKEYGISTLIRAFTHGTIKDKEIVYKEINKCILLCKNCHTELHNKLRDEQ
jgi:hypothetical protein